MSASTISNARFWCASAAVIKILRHLVAGNLCARRWTKERKQLLIASGLLIYVSHDLHHPHRLLSEMSLLAMSTMSYWLVIVSHRCPLGQMQWHKSWYTMILPFTIKQRRLFIATRCRMVFTHSQWLTTASVSTAWSFVVQCTDKNEWRSEDRKHCKSFIEFQQRFDGNKNKPTRARPITTGQPAYVHISETNCWLAASHRRNISIASWTKRFTH